MNTYDKIHEGPEAASHGKLTAKAFLGKVEGITGYSNPTEYLIYLRSLRQAEVDDLEAFFGFVKAGLRIENYTQTRKDRGGRKYVFPRFLMSKANSGHKVITEAGMGKFVTDYAEGRVEIDFTLSELAEEAMNP